MRSEALDHLVTFQRAALVDDGLSSSEVWDDHGSPQWASRKDVSDGERYRAGEVAASLTTRFQVRWSEFTADLTAKDRLTCEGVAYDIVGIKTLGRRVGLEITAAARNDLWPTLSA